MTPEEKKWRLMQIQKTTSDMSMKESTDGWQNAIEALGPYNIRPERDTTTTLRRKNIGGAGGLLYYIFERDGKDEWWC